ncbi:DUF2071 domain-containing protein [Saccharopolyspora sp. K220]|nr:DUF2071 domain-containing protein [Saccharopolyspora soli]
MLAPGTRPDLFAGTSWIGLVGLRMSVASLLGCPVRLRLTELNVRTYVVDCRGRRGLAFLTMEASNPVFATAASAVARLPYRTSVVECSTSAGEIGYHVERSGVGLRLRVRRGDRVAPTESDRFLTARWRMYSTWHGCTVRTPVQHEPWALDSAELLDFVDSGLLGELGLAPPSIPIVRCASRIDARFGMPALV